MPDAASNYRQTKKKEVLRMQCWLHELVVNDPQQFAIVKASKRADACDHWDVFLPSLDSGSYKLKVANEGLPKEPSASQLRQQVVDLPEGSAFECQLGPGRHRISIKAEEIAEPDFDPSQPPEPPIDDLARIFDDLNIFVSVDGTKVVELKCADFGNVPAIPRPASQLRVENPLVVVYESAHFGPNKSGLVVWIEREEASADK